jgi:hypothetical protein
MHDFKVIMCRELVGCIICWKLNKVNVIIYIHVCVNVVVIQVMFVI